MGLIIPGKSNHGSQRRSNFCHYPLKCPQQTDPFNNPVRGCIQMFKILIVDPNDPFRKSLKKVLMTHFPFIDIQEAADGTEGMDKVNSFDPNLIFLEIHLPAQSGLDLARRIKSDHPEIVIVILTSYDLPEYQTAAEESGVAHLVPKDDWSGADMTDLVELILSDLDVDGHADRRVGNSLRQDSL